MTPLLSEEDQNIFKKDVDFLSQLLSEALVMFKRNLIAFDKRDTKAYTKSLLDIVARFRYQTESVNQLMPSFLRDYRLKSSISLLLRSICSDSLTALYLISFYDDKDKEHTALKNELDVLSSEYLQFVKKSMEADHEFLVENNIESNKSYEDKLKWFNGLDSELIDSEGQILSKKKIRENTPDYLKTDLDNNGKFISEEQKYNHIKSRGLGHYGFLFIAFKYYSQFQHFNPMSKKLIEHKPLHDTFWMGLVLDLMLKVSYLLLKISDTPNENLKSEIKSMTEKIKKHFAQQRL